MVTCPLLLGVYRPLNEPTIAEEASVKLAFGSTSLHEVQKVLRLLPMECRQPAYASTLWVHM